MTRKDDRALGRRLTHVASMLVMALAVVACHSQQTPPSNTNAVDEVNGDGESYPAGVSGLNYSTYGIARFSITDAEGRTGGGPNISPSKGDGKPAGGGKEKCCVVVPAQWREDMIVSVRWQRDTHPYNEADRSGDQWLKAVAKVPPYKRLTRGFWVRFLPDDRIVVQVNDQNLYIPAPVKDQDLYVTQGVLDDEANKAMQAARERDRQAAEKFRKRLREQNARVATERETK
jgi:hypothetical protein